MFHPDATQPVAVPQARPWLEAAGLLRGIATLPTLTLPRYAPRGDGGPVRVLPGYLTNDVSTVVIRRYLAAMGYRARGWGLGTNRGDVAAYADQVVALVEADATQSGQSVRLVGWSLGGVIAREVARRIPDQVRQVVTLGSPVVGGPKYTLAAASYVAQGWDLDEIAATVARRNQEPVPVPVTAIYSRADGVVAWQACLDPHPDANVRHLEVSATHAELGFQASTLRLIARALAQPA